MKNALANPIIAGLSYMIAIVLIGSFLTALLLQYTSLSEAKIPIFTYGVNLIGLLIGGFISGRRASERGWFYGGISGFLYGCILLLVAFLAFDAEFTSKSFVSLIGAFSSAAIGGIFGVNVSRK